MQGKFHLILAIALAVIAALLVQTMVNSERRKLREKWRTVKILIAAQTIKPGTPLTIDVVTEGEIPEQFYTDAMLTPSDFEFNRRRVIVHRIERGQPIYFFNLEGQENEKRLGHKLRPGDRAVTINVNAAGAVGYWIQPGDHVDVLATVKNVFSENPEQVTVTIMENVVVLKTGNRGQGVNDPTSRQFSYNTITLLVNPMDAERLVLAQRLGAITLTLRNPDDRTVIENRDKEGWTNLKTLLTGVRTKKLTRRRIRTMDMIKIFRYNQPSVPGAR